MIQRGEQFGFALKPREPIGIVGERVGQNLDRDLALQPRVARAIHLAHAACAEQRDDFVRPDAACPTSSAQNSEIPPATGGAHGGQFRSP